MAEMAAPFNRFADRDYGCGSDHDRDALAVAVQLAAHNAVLATVIGLGGRYEGRSPNFSSETPT